MNKRYILKLSPSERAELSAYLLQKRQNQKKARHIRIILATDQGEGGKAMTDEAISQAYDVTTRTVRNVRKRCVESGLWIGINGKRREINRADLKVNQQVSDQIVHLSQEVPPEGFSSWSLRLLADHLVELNYVSSISHETVRQVLKKTR